MSGEEFPPGERLAALEARLEDLQARLRLLESGRDTRGAAAAPRVAAPEPLPPRAPPIVAEATAPAASAGGEPPSIRRQGLVLSAPIVLGWAGAAALVLAAAYLIRLGIAYGWLTPTIQVAAAGGLGLAMVGGGLALRARDRPYASLLSAGGVAVLYLAVFGGHLYHHLFGSLAAMGLVVSVAGLSLVLHAAYREPLFVAFALAGSYATPLLIRGRGGIGDLAIYLAVWNLVYSTYAVWIGRRAVYLAALYASMVVFEIARADVGSEAWQVAAAFQLGQFALFVAVAVWLSVHVRRPMSQAAALAHFPALLLFYVIEYQILSAHVPAAAPWVAVGFAAALYAAHGTARVHLGEPPGASHALIQAFGAIVLVHAVFWDATPQSWRPLAGLAIATAIMLLPRVAPRLRSGFWPYSVAAAVVYAIGAAELIEMWDWGSTVADTPLALAYPALLYALYFSRPVASEGVRPTLLLTLSHAELLGACALLIDRWLGQPGTTVERLWLSFAWAAAGVAFLAAARRRRDRLLARSTLGIFALFAGKVLLFDLSEAAPLVRVGCLIVLGLSLYAGGWIYRRVLAPAAAE